MAAELDDVFFALASPTRRQILETLTAGEAGVQELAEPFAMSLNSVSKHIKILERAGLIHRQIRGREHRCTLVAEPLSAAAEFVARYEAFWGDRLESLDRYLADEARARRREADPAGDR